MDQAYLPGTVRHRIQELIKERKITQAELAAEIGMAESTLSRFLSEKTDKIGDEYIIKIADFLGVSTDFILGQTDFPERRNYDAELIKKFIRDFMDIAQKQGLTNERPDE